MSVKKQSLNLREITLETIDQAVVDWFDKIVDAHVEAPNRERKKVPVVWSQGERWVTARDAKGIRDNNGVLILPIIAVRRTMVDPSPIMSALGAETPTLTISKRISKKTSDLANLWKTRRPGVRHPEKPVVYEITSYPFPDRNILTYELQVQTQYTSQMNSIIEKINYQLDIAKSFFIPLITPEKNGQGNPKTGVQFDERMKASKDYVVGFMDQTISNRGNIEEFTDQERIIRFDTSFTVPAVLRLSPEGVAPSVKVERTAYKLNFDSENVTFVDNIEDLDDFFH